MTTHLTRDAFDGLVTQALNRMDEKGETAAEAAENVTGGNRDLDARIVAALSGEAATAAVERRAPMMLTAVTATTPKETAMAPTQVAPIVVTRSFTMRAGDLTPGQTFRRFSNPDGWRTCRATVPDTRTWTQAPPSHVLLTQETPEASIVTEYLADETVVEVLAQ